MKRLIVLPLLILALYGHGQVAQEIRREFPVGEDYHNFTIAPMGELGMVVFGSDKLDYSLRRWKFTMLNTNLESIDSVTIDIPRQLYYSMHIVENDRLILFFANARRKVFRMVILDAGTMTLKDFSGNIPSKVMINAMVLCGKTLFVSMSYRYKMHLLAINTETGRSKVNQIKVSGSKRLIFEGLEVPAGHNQALLYVGYFAKKQAYLMQVQLWNDEGTFDEFINLSKPTDRTLTAISGTLLAPDHYIFVGAYSTGHYVTSSGFFISEVEKGKRTYIEYHNFLDLKNFTSYMPKRQQARMERKKARADNRGKELNRSFLMVGQKILHINGRNYFLAEFFYPTYRMETTYTANGGTTTRRVFDGFQYTHASLICFDDEGQKLWDNTFEMWVPYKPMSVVRFVAGMVDAEGRVDLAYTSNKNIYSKSFDHNGKILRERTTTGFDTGGEDEKVKRSVSWMNHWYGDVFVAYGFQVIKDKGKSLGNRNRRVYFINKISPQ
jgi:hypothetical protein